MVEKTKIVKLNLSVLGVYIRLARIQEGISLRALSKLTNISHTLISNIEKGKQTPSEETLRDIMSALNLTLNTSEELSERMAYYYKNTFSALLNYKNDEAKVFINELIKDSDLYTNSLEVINFHIIRSLYYVLTNEQTINYDFALFDQIVDYLSTEQQQLLYFIKGMAQLQQFMFRDAELNFHKALEIRSSDLNVLINEYLVIANLYQYKFTNSVSLSNQVVEEYETRSNYLRAMKCRLLIARVYLKIMKFDKVMVLVDHVTQFSNQFGVQSLLDDCHVIKAGVYFYQKEYEYALKELDQVVDQSIERYAYTRFRIYLLSKDERLKDYYNELTSDTSKLVTPSTKLLIKIIMKWQKNEYRDEVYINEIDQLRELAVKGNDQELIGLTYNLMIQYYKEDRKYKKALEISEELLKQKKIHIMYYSIKPTNI